MQRLSLLCAPTALAHRTARHDHACRVLLGIRGLEVVGSGISLQMELTVDDSVPAVQLSLGAKDFVAGACAQTTYS